MAELSGRQASCMLFQIFLENKLLVKGGGGGVFIKNKNELPLMFMFCEGK